MRRVFTWMLAVCLTGSLLTACASDKSGGQDDSKLQIVTTIAPEYDWVQHILGDNPAGAETTLLLDDGVDLHNYQPTADDIMKIATCDLFIYVGGESDEWVEDALQEATNPDMIAINLLEELGDQVKEEEIVEGMEAEEEHEHGDEDEDAEHEEDADHEEDHEEGEEEDAEYDEHVWLSLRNADYLCNCIAGHLGKADPENAEVYQANADAYRKQMIALDEQYLEAVDGAAQKTLLFGDRFPFRYMVDDYGLDYYAAFVGCSAETEASFETVSFLAKKVDELGLTHVCAIEGADHKIAETIIKNTKNQDQEIVTFNSMQSTTSKDLADGQTYLSVMEDNLAALKQALAK